MSFVAITAVLLVMVILCVLQIDCGVVLKNVQNCDQKNTVDTNVEGKFWLKHFG